MASRKTFVDRATELWMTAAPEELAMALRMGRTIQSFRFGGQKAHKPVARKKAAPRVKKPVSVTVPSGTQPF